MSDNIFHLQRDSQRVAQKPQPTEANAARAQNAKAAETSPPPAPNAGKDPVTMSQAASQMKALTHAAKESSGIDFAKVERIKTAIAEGRYPLDARATAAKMLELDGTLEFSNWDLPRSER